MANSTAKVSIKSLDDGYCLVVNGEESEPANYGEPLEMETSDGKRFIAFIDAEGQEIVSSTEFWAYEVSPVVDVPILEDEDEDEQEGDEDDEDDEDEEETDPVEDDQTTKV